VRFLTDFRDEIKAVVRGTTSPASTVDRVREVAAIDGR